MFFLVTKPASWRRFQQVPKDTLVAASTSFTLRRGFEVTRDMSSSVSITVWSVSTSIFKSRLNKQNQRSAVTASEKPTRATRRLKTVNYTFLNDGNLEFYVVSVI